MKTGVFRMIRHEQMVCRFAQGWRYAADLGPIHGEYSILVWWCCGDCGGEFAP